MKEGTTRSGPYYTHSNGNISYVVNDGSGKVISLDECSKEQLWDILNWMDEEIQVVYNRADVLEKRKKFVGRLWACKDPRFNERNNEHTTTYVEPKNNVFGEPHHISTPLKPNGDENV